MVLRKVLCLLLAVSFVAVAIPPTPNPISSTNHRLLMADGGSPVPPWPWPSTGLTTSQPASVLKADGGSPVPPWPWPTGATA